jgi:hypothetical protein
MGAWGCDQLHRGSSPVTSCRSPRCSASSTARPAAAPGPAPPCASSHTASRARLGCAGGLRRPAPPRPRARPRRRPPQHPDGSLRSPHPLVGRRAHASSRSCPQSSPAPSRSQTARRFRTIAEHMSACVGPTRSSTTVPSLVMPAKADLRSTHLRGGLATLLSTQAGDFWRRRANITNRRSDHMVVPGPRSPLASGAVARSVPKRS